MAKSGGGGAQKLLLEKGEKIGLGIAVTLGGLLLIVGVMEIFNREDPETFAKAVETKEASLRSAMAGPAQPIDPLTGPIVSAVSNQPLAVATTNKPLFDPYAPPDGRRIAPIVERLVEGQVDIAVVKIPGYDIVVDRDNDGNVTNMKIGVVTAKMTKDKPQGVSDFIKDVSKITRVPRRPRAGGNMGGMFGGMGGMFGGDGGGMGSGSSPGPGGMLGFGSPPGMGSGSSPAGMGGFPPGMGMGGFPPGMGFGGVGMGGGMRGGGSGLGMGGFSGGDSTQQAQTRFEVDYVNGLTDEEIEAKMNGRRMAVTIHPVRMAVIQAAFPYRLQIERFKTALRYKTVEELYANIGDMPVFNGVEIQRRGYLPNGTMVEDWTKIDPLEDNDNRDLRAYALQDREDPIDLQRVMLPEDYMLVMMLPQELVGKYPAMNLQTVKDAIKKLKDAGGKVSVPPAPSKYSGAGNPFKRNGGSNVGNLIGGGGAGGMGGDDGGGAGSLPGFPPRPPKMGGDGGGSNVTTSGKIEPPDVAYIRMIDPSIKEGVVYQYRMRVKLLNPNYGKVGLVSKNSDADNKEMPLGEEHWFEIPSRVQVPAAGYYYVVDPTVIPAKEKEKMAFVPPTPKEGQALIQTQRWYRQLVMRGGTEPIGDWVVADIIATRGMYVTGQSFTQLPFWSSVYNEFQLREIPGDKPPPKGKEQRKGALVEPFRPKTLLAVDIQGGKTRVKIPSNPGEAKLSRTGSVEEECATEVLFLAPDGRLEVRSSTRDREDPDRKERESAFKKWVKDTEEKNAKLNPSGGTPPKDGF